MNQSKFLRAIGVKAKYTTDGIYEFPGQVVSLLNEICAWEYMTNGAVFKKDKYDIHITHAYNGTYFKYDGPGSPEDCINLIAYDTETGEAFLIGCRIAWNKKECVDRIISYKKLISELTPEKIEERKAVEKKVYTWRFFS